MGFKVLFAILPLLLTCSACISGGPSIEPRYFSAGPAFDGALGGAPSTGPVHQVNLAPPRVVAHLRDRIVWRTAAGEVGFLGGGAGANRLPSCLRADSSLLSLSAMDCYWPQVLTRGSCR